MNPSSKIFHLFFLFLIVIPNLSSQEEDSFFRLPVPLIINSDLQGEISLFLDNDNNIYLNNSELSETLLEYIDIAQFNYNISNGNFIHLKDMESSEISFLYNENELYFSITIPIELLKPEIMSIHNKRTYNEKYIITPENFSTYLNIFASNGFKAGSYVADYYLENVINLYDFVLETKTSFDQNMLFTNPEIKLIYAFNGLNFILGENSINSTGFQQSGNYHGLSVSSDTRDFTGNLMPLYIYEKSKVNIRLNNRTVKTLTLNPGYYNLADIPYCNGINNMELTITSLNGITSILEVPLSSNNKVLEVGMADFYAFTGFPAWNPTSFNLTGYFNYGLFDWLTLNGNLQLTNSNILPELGASLSSMYGNFYINNGLYTDFSKNNMGYAINLSYIYSNNAVPYLPTFSLNMDFMTRDFPDNSDISDKMFEISGTISQKITDKMNYTVQSSFLVDHNKTNNLLANLRLNYIFNSDFTGNLAFRTSISDPSLSNSSLSLLFTYLDRKRDTASSYSHNLVTEKQVVDIQKNLFDGDLNLSGSIESGTYLDDLDYQFSSDLNYSGSRLNTTGFLSHQIFDKDSDTQVGLSLGLALVYTSGILSITKPISDSFSIIVPDISLKDKELGINFNGNKYETKSDFFGPAVISSLSSGSIKDITIDVINPNSYFYLSDNKFYLKPTYRSGSIIYAGDKEEVIVEGQLINREGKPLPYLIGYIDVSGEIKDFFSDDNGELYIYGLAQGVYTLHVEGYESRDISIVTSPEQTLMKLDIILVEKGE